MKSKFLRTKEENKVNKLTFKGKKSKLVNLLTKRINRKLNKKAQLTIIIIASIIVAAVLTATVYFTNIISKEKVKAEAKKIDITILKTTSVNNYITSCLETTSNEALTRIGKQGGVFFKDQNGSIITTEVMSAEYENYKVAYQIRSPQFVLPSPEYPCFISSKYTYPSPQNPCGYYHNLTSFLFARPGNFKLTLCKNSTLGYVCSPGQSPPYYSTQEQLENYIKNQTLQCIDFSYFENITGLRFDKERTKNITVSISINENDIDVNANIPFAFSGASSLFEAEKYSTKENVRLKDIITLVNDIIEKEKNDVTFEATNPKTLHVPKGILLTRKRGAYNKDSLIIINDTQSSIGGKTFIFQFYVQNRPPALDYFPERKSPNPNYDLMLFSNTTIEIIPTAYDPDEDEITYIYTGWKSGEMQNSEFYKKGDYEREIIPKKAATVRATDQDIGYHNFTITATDGAFSDWQTIRVFIDRDIIAKAFGYNHYLDLKNRIIASTEDPYTLDATKSSVSMFQQTTYTWEDTVEQDTLLYQGAQSTFVLPNEKPDIKNMKGVFDKTGEHTLYLTVSAQKASADTFVVPVYACLPHKSPSAPYPFNSIKWDSYPEEEDAFQANHACCLSQPFGEIDKNKGVCYKFEEYTCRYNQYELTEPQYLNEEHYFASLFKTGNPATEAELVKIKAGNLWPATKSLKPDETILKGVTIDLTKEDQRANDIYKRTYSVSCKGDRGNICDGEKTDEWQASKQCTVAQYCSYGKQDCQNWRYTPGKPDEDYLCNPVLKCVSAPVTQKSYAFPSLTNPKYLVRGVADGLGQCNAAVISYDGSPAYTNKNIYPAGILKMGTQYFLSVECSYYNGYKNKGSPALQPGEIPSSIKLENEKMPSLSQLEPACDPGSQIIPSSLVDTSYLKPGEANGYGELDQAKNWLNIKMSRKYTCSGQECKAERADLDENEKYCNQCGLKWTGGQCCGDDPGATAATTDYTHLKSPEFLPGAQYFGSQENPSFVSGKSACCTKRGMCAVNGACVAQGDVEGDYCCASTGVSKKPSSGCTGRGWFFWKKWSCTASGWQCVSSFGGGGFGNTR